MISHRITTVHIFPDPDQLATAVATALVTEVAQHPKDRPFCIALSGGSTPQRLYEVLAQPPFCEQLMWHQIAFFFGDERCVPPEHPDSNYRMVHEAMFSRIVQQHLSFSNHSMEIYRMQAESEAAEDYERLLKQRLPHNPQGVPVFDLVVLGIGEDGHTASLFPGTAALQETHRWVVMNDVPQLSTRRMTLTFPVINAARSVWILATGAKKQPVVSAVLAAKKKPSGLDQADIPDFPIFQVRPNMGIVTWWLDQEAANTR